MQLILKILGILAILVITGAVVFRILDRTNGTLISSGEKRSYLLYVPESYDPSKPAPLVVTIHGFAQWPAHQMRTSRWNELADEYGFIVVYPSGTRFPKRWRTRSIPGSELDVVKDVTFISDLIDQLETEYNIDPSRIYVNGLSNGGGMSFLLACELSNRIAAVGTVAGAFSVSWELCKPSRPVPIMVFHGTGDRIVPFQGGSYRGGYALPSIPDWVETLAKRYGCTDEPGKIAAPGKVSGVHYKGCSADVIFYTIRDGGHSWPGGRPIPAWIVGATNMDIDATRLLWEFFQQHPLNSLGA